MSPFVIEAVASIIRWALAIGAALLVSHGIWTPTAADSYVSAAATKLAYYVVSGVLGLVPLVWGIWQKYQSRLVLVTALSSGPSSEESIKLRIISGLPTPAVSTPSDMIPIK